MPLTVKTIPKKDAGQGIAAIPQAELNKNDIDQGDYVLLRGDPSDESQKAVAKAYLAYEKDARKSIVRIDGRIRNNLGVSVDDQVLIEPIDIAETESVTLSISDDINIKGDIEPILHEALVGRPIKSDITVDIQLGLGQVSETSSGQEIQVFILETTPKDVSVVAEDTTLVLDSSTEAHTTENPESTNADQTKNDDTNALSSATAPGITYEDIGGLEDELQHIREMVELPMNYPEVFQQLGIDPPKGVLLHGPPGTGKTMIAKAVANEVDASFHNINGPEIMSKDYGGSEKQLREVFDAAQEDAPAIVFMDEVDSIAPKREDTGHEASQRVVAQMLSLMDGLERRGDIVVIGATNRVDAIDPALRRGGRFDREIEVGVPDKDGRLEALHIHTRDMPLTADVDIEAYAERTHGFVGADLQTFSKEAAMNALRRIRSKIDFQSNTIDARLLNSLEVRGEDFETALQEVDPSAMREVFVEVPDVEWDDVGGLEDTKHQLQEVVQWPIKYDFLFDKADVDGSSGVLLHGPPGTGKTMLAKAVANESDANFISIDGPEIISKWVGEAEERIREVFDKARSNAPTVVFFDEIDAIATQRDGEGKNNVSERVVSQLLTELDGLEALNRIVVIATSNRPDLIDDALRRHGRFDREIEVGIPTVDSRRKVFEVHIDEKPTTVEVDAGWLATKTDGYVGADIEAVCNEASMIAMREFVQRHDDEAAMRRNEDAFLVTREHFEQAVASIEPSVDGDTLDDYGLDSP